MAAGVWTPYTPDMRRDDAIANLRRLLPTIRRDFGVRRIALFGSTARRWMSARQERDWRLYADDILQA